MPGSSDPNIWQTLLDSRFFQALVTAFTVATAVGVALSGYLKRYKPESSNDKRLKEDLENGLPGHILKQVAHELHDIREGLQDVRERVSRIEGILESNEGD